MAPDNRLECPKEGSLSPAGHRGRERSWEGSPQEAATKEMYSPKRFQGGGGDTFHGDAGRGSRRGWQREGQQWHPRLPGFPPPKKDPFWSLGLFGFIVSIAYLMRLLKLIDIIHLVEHNKVDSSLCKEVSGLS